jgi:hypothetical protein
MTYYHTVNYEDIVTNTPSYTLHDIKYLLVDSKMRTAISETSDLVEIDKSRTTDLFEEAYICASEAKAKVRVLSAQLEQMMLTLSDNFYISNNKNDLQQILNYLMSSDQTISPSIYEIIKQLNIAIIEAQTTSRRVSILAAVEESDFDLMSRKLIFTVDKIDSVTNIISEIHHVSDNSVDLNRLAQYKLLC